MTIHLAYPGLLLVGVCLLLPYLVRPRQAWYYSYLKLLPESKKIDLPFVFTACITWSALILILIALARPQEITTQRIQRLETRDILLVLDLSFSMEGTIFSEREQKTVSKLDLLQQVSLEFVQRHPHDRLGLIVFGDEAFGVWPLSMDSTTLRKRLQHLHTLLPKEVRGTHIAKGLERALDHFQELGQAQTKLLLLFTDGMDTIDPVAAEYILQELRRNKITLYLLGIQLRDDTDIVQLTRQAQGRYFHIQQEKELEAALQEIEHLEKSHIEVVSKTEPKELYPIFAFTGLLLLLLSIFLKHTWVLEM